MMVIISFLDYHIFINFSLCINFINSAPFMDTLGCCLNKLSRLNVEVTTRDALTLVG
jgi:hypothetical protein